MTAGKNIMEKMIQLVMISGRSGSGKSAAIHILEDIGFYCVDNLPVGLLSTLINQQLEDTQENNRKLAVGIDARNNPKHLANFAEISENIEKNPQVSCTIIYLDADDQTLIQRFSETKRKHPLSSEKISLSEAVSIEEALLEPIASKAHITLDTSKLNLHQLRDLIKNQVHGNAPSRMSVLFYSFGFKHGIPVDSDLVFDVRCLPNPFWSHSLREYNGLDAEIIAFLEKHESVQKMLHDVGTFLDTWLPRFEANNRSYMTVAIGCTGGQHRSVYFAEALFTRFKSAFPQVQVRHRQLVKHS